MQAVDSSLIKGATTAGDLPGSVDSEMCISSSLEKERRGEVFPNKRNSRFHFGRGLNPLSLRGA